MRLSAPVRVSWCQRLTCASQPARVLLAAPRSRPATRAPRWSSASVRAMAAPPPPSLRHVVLPASGGGARPPPLLVLLHGTGADEHDLLSCGRDAQAAFGGQLVVASVRAPLRAAWGGYAWFEGFSSAPARVALDRTVSSSAAAVLAFLEAAPATLGCDAQRIFLLGFSQGATVGWSVMTRAWPRHDLLRGACLLSGRLFPEHASPGAPLAATVAPAAELRGRRLWVTHGESDGVTPFSLARDSLRVARALFGDDDAALAAAVTFAPHRSGHDIPDAAMQAAAVALRAWSDGADAPR